MKIRVTIHHFIRKNYNLFRVFLIILSGQLLLIWCFKFKFLIKFHQGSILLFMAGNGRGDVLGPQIFQKNLGSLTSG